MLRSYSKCRFGTFPIESLSVITLESTSSGLPARFLFFMSIKCLSLLSSHQTQYGPCVLPSKASCKRSLRKRVTRLPGFWEDVKNLRGFSEELFNELEMCSSLCHYLLWIPLQTCYSPRECNQVLRWYRVSLCSLCVSSEVIEETCKGHSFLACPVL